MNIRSIQNQVHEANKLLLNLHEKIAIYTRIKGKPTEDFMEKWNKIHAALSLVGSINFNEIGKK